MACSTPWILKKHLQAFRTGEEGIWQIFTSKAMIKYDFHKKYKIKTFQDSGNQLKAYKLRSIYSWNTTEP